MPGPNEPGYNVLHAPGTRAHKAYSNFWKSFGTYDLNRYRRAAKYTQAITRVRQR